MIQPKHNYTSTKLDHIDQQLNNT